MPDCQYKLLGILFLKIVFLKDQIIELCQLLYLFSSNDYTILNIITFILFIIICLKLEIKLYIIYLSFLYNILF